MDNQNWPDPPNVLIGKYHFSVINAFELYLMVDDLGALGAKFKCSKSIHCLAIVVDDRDPSVSLPWPIFIPFHTLRKSGLLEKRKKRQRSHARKYQILGDK